MHLHYLIFLSACTIALMTGGFATEIEDEEALKRKMEDSIKDLFEEPPDEGRFFSYDRMAAFNTSVAFTIPLLSFSLPGAKTAIAAGLDANTFGVLAFGTFFLIAALGVAIYITSQANDAEAMEEARMFGSDEYASNLYLNQIYISLADLLEALDVKSCAKQSVCEAHAEPQRYGLLGWPIRLLVPANTGIHDGDQSSFSKAANFGYEKLDECYYEFPCIVQPLDVVLKAKEYLSR